MKLDFAYKNDGKPHEYCIKCHAEGIDKLNVNNKTCFKCKNCDAISDRRIFIDPVINWSITDDLEFWHETAGIFIRNKNKQFLFYERNIFPFAFTVPAGHVDAGEKPIDTAYREVFEEVGLKLDNLRLIGVENINDDSCSRGSDAHKWHIFLGEIDNINDIVVKEEGDNPVWLTIDEITGLGEQAIVPVRRIIPKYKYQLLQ